MIFTPNFRSFASVFAEMWGERVGRSRSFPEIRVMILWVDVVFVSRGVAKIIGDDFLLLRVRCGDRICLI